ncbi:hypothetical protein BC826DRAFT_1032786 [Russula brevipes]|nr:hypothetical protein BC826DRAFT_1032786 [Russula brevipes]
MLHSIGQILPGPVSLEKQKQLCSPFRQHAIVPRRIRGFFVGLVILASLALLYCLHYFASPSDDLLVLLRDLPRPEGGNNPPRFYEWHDREKRLPQHNPDLPYPQGRDGRYIRFANQLNGLGFGNALQEMLFNAHLAYLAKRIYVFENYTWAKTSGDFSHFNDNPIPARVPLTSLLSGPIAGDPFPSSTGGSPAVIPEFFNQVCPNLTIIDRQEVDRALPVNASAATIVRAWLHKLEQTDDRCIEIKEFSGQIFDYMLFGNSTRLLDIWPSLVTSPVLTHFSWSLLIIAALRENARAIHPALSSVTPASLMPSSNLKPLSGLLALHIRRGDYIDHCVSLTGWDSHFMGFNEFPDLPDRFFPSSDEAEKQLQYRAHCFPDVEQIVARVREVRASLLSTTRLSRAYVLTNGRREWLEELKDALQDDARREGLDPWVHIGTSRDLNLTKEQRHNSQAMDMAVAQRAEVFVGNGFSSLTSNVVMLRAAQGVPWEKNRFW